MRYFELEDDFCLVLMLSRGLVLRYNTSRALPTGSSAGWSAAGERGIVHNDASSWSSVRYQKVWKAHISYEVEHSGGFSRYV